MSGSGRHYTYPRAVVKTTMQSRPPAKVGEGSRMAVEQGVHSKALS
jgi:hypothetical protein